MTDFRKFVWGIGLSFGLPWLCMVVLPAMSYQQLKPVAYDKEKDGVDGYYPQQPINHLGGKVYAREGCVQCHSQMVRAAHVGLDAWRKGWGEDQSERAPDPVRANTLRDYMGEPHSFLGIQRSGPDLANAGYRLADRKKIHQSLYAPRSVREWSTMPAYRHLYTVQKRQGPLSERALDLPERFKPAKGYEVVPTPAAEQLVDYLLSLKKAGPVPGMAAALAAKK